MATLHEVTGIALREGEPYQRARVRIYVADINGTPVSGNVDDVDGTIGNITTFTDAAGFFSVDLYDNRDIEPAGTVHWVKIGTFDGIAVSAVAPGTVDDLQVISGPALGAAAVLNDLADVDTGGVTDGQVIVWNETDGVWEPGAGGGGGGVTDGDKGDVTVASSGTVWTVPDLANKVADTGDTMTGGLTVTSAAGITVDTGTDIDGETQLLSDAVEIKADASNTFPAGVLRYDGLHAGSGLAGTDTAFSRINAHVWSIGSLDVIRAASAPSNDADLANKAYVDDEIAGVGGITDGDKGDITVSGSGATWTIDNGAVTAAQVAADVATQAELDTVASGAQPVDSDLTAIAALTTTAYGRALLESVDDADLRDQLDIDAVVAGNGIELDTSTPNVVEVGVQYPITGGTDLAAGTTLQTWETGVNDSEGKVTIGFYSIIGPGIQFFGNKTDTIPSLVFAAGLTDGLYAGPGGATALDVSLTRTDVNTWSLSGLHKITASAQPTAASDLSRRDFVETTAVFHSRVFD